MTDRQTKILEIVNQKKKVEVVTLSQMLEVSQKKQVRSYLMGKRSW